MICYAEQYNQLRPAEGKSSESSICVATLAGFFIGDNQMERIPLTQGQFTIVDNEDFGWLSKFKWCALWQPKTQSFYAARYSKRKNGKRYLIYMARQILGLTYGDKHQADHIYHDTLDNRRSELQIVTNQQNNFNRKNSKGYHWNKPAKKYLAQIKLNGKQIHLGYFQVAQEAHSAYLQAKKRYHKF